MRIKVCISKKKICGYKGFEKKGIKNLSKPKKAPLLRNKTLK
jgi:hypothetical protein